MNNNEEKCCGSCALFSNEDIDGYGNCMFHLEPAHCSESCEDYLPEEKPEAKNNDLLTNNQ